MASAPWPQGVVRRGGVIAWMWLAILPVVFLPTRWMPEGFDHWTWEQALLLALGLVVASLQVMARPGPLRWLGACGLATVASALAWAFRTAALTADVLAVLTACLAAVATIAHARPAAIRKALAVLWWSNVLACALDALRLPVHAWAWFGVRQGNPYGVAGIGGNPNLSAVLVVAAGPFALLEGPRAVRWMAAGAGCWALVALHSFGAAVAAAAATGAWGLAATAALPIHSLRVGAASAALGLALGLGLFAGIVHRPGPERLEAWRLAARLPLLGPRAALVGFGPGSWQTFGFGRTILVDQGRQAVRTTWLTVHNDHLQVWFEGGLLGAVAWAGLAASTLASAWGQRRIATGRALLAATVGWLVAAGASFPSHVPVTGALGLALVVLAQRMREEPGLPA